jgi:hypothetical protein
MLSIMHGNEIQFQYNPHSIEPLKEHVPFLFHDCLGREIKVGDVLANGQRQGSHGGIRVGIVRGFTERSILVDIVDDGYPAYRRGQDHTMPYKEWTLRKSHFNTGYNCLITGMTEMQIREMTETQEGIFGDPPIEI